MTPGTPRDEGTFGGTEGEIREGWSAAPACDAIGAGFGPCSGPVQTLLFPLAPELNYAAVQVSVCEAHDPAARQVIDALVADAQAKANNA